MANYVLPDNGCEFSNLFFSILHNTPQPLYKMVHYSTVLDTNGSLLDPRWSFKTDFAIKRYILLSITQKANMDTGLDPTILL